jgi:hypothetical protein
LTARSFHRAVAATLTEADVPALSSAQREELLDFVDGQLRALPAHLAFGVSSLASLLAAGVVAERRRPFAALPAAARLTIVERWARAAFAPARLYVRLLRSLVVYGGHELLTEPAGVGA